MFAALKRKHFVITGFRFGVLSQLRAHVAEVSQRGGQGLTRLVVPGFLHGFSVPMARLRKIAAMQMNAGTL